MACVAGAIVGAAVIGGVASMVSASQQADAVESAAKRQEENAKKATEKQEQAIRKSESNKADTSALLQQNVDSTASGGSTILTGAQGIDTNSLTLSKSNTLG